MASLYGGQGLRGSTGSSLGQKLGGYKVNQLQQFTPEQMQLFQSLFSHVSPESFTSKLAQGDEEIFNQIEQPALRQFGQLQGNLASRFSGLGGAGSLGSRRSSGFQNTMNQASSDFLQDLQSRRQSLQRQALQDLMGMSRDLLSQQPYDQFITPKKPSFLESLLGILGSGLGQATGGKLSGLFGGN